MNIYVYRASDLGGVDVASDGVQGVEEEALRIQEGELNGEARDTVEIKGEEVRFALVIDEDLGVEGKTPGEEIDPAYHFGYNVPCLYHLYNLICFNAMYV